MVQQGLDLRAELTASIEKHEPLITFRNAFDLCKEGSASVVAALDAAHDLEDGGMPLSYVVVKALLELEVKVLCDTKNFDAIKLLFNDADAQYQLLRNVVSSNHYVAHVSRVPDDRKRAFREDAAFTALTLAADEGATPFLTQLLTVSGLRWYRGP